MYSLHHVQRAYSLTTAFVLALFVSMAVTVPAAADGPSLRIIEPDEAAERTGLTYAQWSAVWWQTMLALPNDESPIIDRTGEECAHGNTPRIFFLAGDTGDGVGQ